MVEIKKCFEKVFSGSQDPKMVSKTNCCHILSIFGSFNPLISENLKFLKNVVLLQFQMVCKEHDHLRVLH